MSTADPEDLSVLTRQARAPDAIVAYGSDADQVADVRCGDARAADRPLVLIVHGGFWRPQYDRTHTGPMAEAISAAGWTVASVEYRRIPGEPDRTLEDATNALVRLPAQVASHNGRVVLIGHSAGGHIVLWLAAARATPQLAGVLALAPAADLQLADQLNLGDGAARAFVGADPRQRPDIDPRQLPAPRIPVTIIQGEQDAVVPPAVAESYVQAHPRTQLVTLPGMGHFPPIDPQSAAWPAVMKELRALDPG